MSDDILAFLDKKFGKLNEIQKKPNKNKKKTKDNNEKMKSDSQQKEKSEIKDTAIL